MRIERLQDAGGFSATKDYAAIEHQVVAAIHCIEWPSGSGSFSLYPEHGKKRGEGNGVKPIKEACMLKLKGFGWNIEHPLDIGTEARPGKVDACISVGSRLFCVEWETGNISSSHRSLNKMSLGLVNKKLIGGILIVPTREMYKYLTDRVGNFRELEPYFPLWRCLPIDQGVLAVIAIEHDGLSESVPRLPKGTDGRALL